MSWHGRFAAAVLVLAAAACSGADAVLVGNSLNAAGAALNPPVMRGIDGVPGWKRTGAPERYNKEGLYGYIDGGAEIVLEYGFRELSVQRFASRRGRGGRPGDHPRDLPDDDRRGGLRTLFDQARGRRKGLARPPARQLGRPRARQLRQGRLPGERPGPRLRREGGRGIPGRRRARRSGSGHGPPGGPGPRCRSKAGSRRANGTSKARSRPATSRRSSTAPSGGSPRRPAERTRAPPSRPSTGPCRPFRSSWSSSWDRPRTPRPSRTACSPYSTNTSKASGVRTG